MLQARITKFNRWLGSKLPQEQTLWLKRLRRGDHDWQSTARTMQQARNDSGSSRQALQIRGKNVSVIERGFDAHKVGRENLGIVSDRLRITGIEFVRVPGRTPYAPLLVVRERDTAALVQVIQTLPSRDGWQTRMTDAKGHPVSRATMQRDPSRVATIRVSRNLVGPSGLLMTTTAQDVVIEPWVELGAEVERVDGGSHTPGTIHRKRPGRGPLVEYIEPESWRVTQELHDGHLKWPAPHLYEVTEPIDLVYTWVDGSDPAWQRRKLEASGDIAPNELNETALSESRFTDHDELKYSLRSVEAYANWVNHIYIVTDGQVPPWLDTSHPKITVIDHREIFTDPSVLPVFNSHAIESQLHHIPGLSERYLYMNDDLLFMRPVRPELFFTSNGLSKFFPSRAPLDIGEPSARDLPVLSAAKRGRQFMLDTHGRTVTNKFKHTPHPQTKSVLEEMERDNPELFRKVAASKFRSPEDYSIASALVHFHAYATKRAIVGDISYQYLDIGEPRAVMTLERLLHERKYDVVCLNDTHLGAEEHEQASRRLDNFLTRKLSVQSSFETTGEWTSREFFEFNAPHA